MLNRRTVLAGAALLACPGLVSPRLARAALPVPPGNALSFRIMRKGDRIGTHSLTFSQSGETLTISVKVEIVVKIGPIPVFRYNHDNQEVWTGTALQGFDSKTNDDGKAAFGRMQRSAAGFQVEGSRGGLYTAPPNTLVATHWNKAELEAPMVNPQNGELLKLTTVPKGEELVALASGAKVKASRFALEGDQPLELWYDEAGTWTALLFKGQDGTPIAYEKL
jgi:hypothetical protein